MEHSRGVLVCVCVVAFVEQFLVAQENSVLFYPPISLEHQTFTPPPSPVFARVSF